MAEKLRAFQLSLGKYLRSPETESLPAGIEARRAKVYEDLLFNNVCGFINACFPVCKKITAASEWTALCRHFFREWRASSPYFNAIPLEFLNYLQNNNVLTKYPPWYFELAHYEWVELYIETIETADTQPISDRTKDLDHRKISTNAPLINLAYHWPVHKITQDSIPADPHPTFLVVFRNSKHQVKFVELNAATAVLVEFAKQPFAEANLAEADLFKRLAGQLNRHLDNNFIAHCRTMINELVDQEVLIKR